MGRSLRHTKTRLALLSRALQRSVSGSGGFTLLEVLVALAILGASLSVIFGVYATVMDRTRNQRLQHEAHTLCASLLERARATGTDDSGDVFGTTPNGLNWRVRTTNYAASEQQPNSDYIPVMITVTVSWSDHGRDVTRTLSTLKLASRRHNG